jgi:hypothetical protein
MDDEPHDDRVSRFRTAWWQRLADEPATYELSRFAILRLLASVYLVAFVSLNHQLSPLIGSGGLLPASRLLEIQRARLGPEAYWRLPTLFWFSASDDTLRAACWAGIALSVAALLGATNAAIQMALWAIYASFVHVGQIFYAYGWETQLLETGFAAAILCPLRSLRPFPPTGTPKIVVWLFRWIIFRVMLGSALIKIRGDPCWRDFTCLDVHFETQPNPNPLSWWLHHSPHALHVAGVMFNYVVELVAPWFAFGLRPYRHAAGVVLAALQVSLILSGNLSFLNWLTLVPVLACFDDTAWAGLLPRSLRRKTLLRFGALAPSRVHARVARGYAVVVAVLSVGPVANLASCDQAMNRSFDPLDLVNTYGAFGSVDRVRYEVVLEGTRAATPDGDGWREYELPCMPGDVRRRPCFVTPYHYRLDWQMWFVGNGSARGEPIDDEPWLVHLVWQLLNGEPSPRSLFAHDPFPGAPPRWIRAGIWRYRFSDGRSPGVWWTRERVGEYLPPVSIAQSSLREYVSAYHWADAPPGD